MPACHAGDRGFKWLERTPDKREVDGSSPFRPIKTWPVGQAVKTPPFHGGNTGSSPVRVICFFGGLPKSG